MEYVIVAVVIVALGFHLFSKNEVVKSKLKPKAKGPTQSAHSVTELKKLTKLQLLNIADKNNIKVKRSGSKADVVKAISSHK